MGLDLRGILKGSGRFRSEIYRQVAIYFLYNTLNNVDPHANIYLMIMIIFNPLRNILRNDWWGIYWEMIEGSTPRYRWVASPIPELIFKSCRLRNLRYLANISLLVAGHWGPQYRLEGLLLSSSRLRYNWFFRLLYACKRSKLHWLLFFRGSGSW